MAFFPDLSPYTYFPGEPPDLVNIGWLGRSMPFPTGETSGEFRAKLTWLCTHRRMQQTRGIHFCPFCPRGNVVAGGSAEIRVPGVDKVYAAQELISHYVVAHQYKPPDVFIEAVLAAPEDGGPSE